MNVRNHCNGDDVAVRRIVASFVGKWQARGKITGKWGGRSVASGEQAAPAAAGQAPTPCTHLV